MVSRKHNRLLFEKMSVFACMSQSEAVMSVHGEVSQKSAHKEEMSEM